MIVLWSILFIIAVILQLALQPSKRTFHGFIEAVLLFLTVVNIGILSLVEAYTYFTEPAEATRATGSVLIHPLQYEVGMALIAFGVLGVLCYWERKEFWLATILGYAIFSFGQGISELVAFERQNLHLTFSFLFSELFMPVCLLILLILYRVLPQKAPPA